MIGLLAGGYAGVIVARKLIGKDKSKNRTGDKTESSDNSSTGDIVFGALVGHLIGFVVVGNIAGEIAIATGANDPNNIAQIAGGITSVIGGVAGAIIAIRLGRNKEEDVSLNITPIYNIAQNGAGLGVVFAF